MHAHLPVGETLLTQGVLSSDQLRIALKEQTQRSQRNGEHVPLGRLLVELGFVSENLLRDALGASLKLDAVDISRCVVDPQALTLCPQALARRLKILPLAFTPNTGVMTLAMSNPHDLAALDQLRAHAGGKIRSLDIRLAGDADIERALNRFYDTHVSIELLLREIETGTSHVAGVASETPQNVHAQPVVRLVEALLAEAVKREASDIHFEPEGGFLRIRCRVDGILRQTCALHAAYWPAMAVRLKVLAGMNIAESRAPQDGHFSLRIAGRAVDFRAATLPVLHGENIVLRILDRDKSILPLADLGANAENIAVLKQLLKRPEGLLLVAGPTGSGKTATLYALLREISHEGVNVMTLEDPVEHPTALIRQTSLADGIKLDFASGIRAMLRQDPDILLIGEIRDEDSAAMALRAAMTGHRVLSTVHAHSSLAAAARLFDIGVKPTVLAGNLIGVVSQRLLRRLCPHCKQARPLTAAERPLWAAYVPELTQVYEAVGCTACEQQGYRGRFAVMETLRITPPLDALIARAAPLGEWRPCAAQHGWRHLTEHALARVAAGDTTVAEVARVIGLADVDWADVPAPVAG